MADILSLAVGTATYFQRLGLLSADVDINDSVGSLKLLISVLYHLNRSPHSLSLQIATTLIQSYWCLKFN